MCVLAGEVVAAVEAMVWVLEVGIAKMIRSRLPTE